MKTVLVRVKASTGPKGLVWRRRERGPEGPLFHGGAEVREEFRRERCGSHVSGSTRSGVPGNYSFAPSGLAFIPLSTHGLRRGLHSCAASRVIRGLSAKIFSLRSQPGRFQDELPVR